MSQDVTPEWRLYDSELSGQLATFIFAGSDTTAWVVSPVRRRHVALITADMVGERSPGDCCISPRTRKSNSDYD